jgi:hypothetical protein
LQSNSCFHVESVGVVVPLGLMVIEIRSQRFETSEGLASFLR